MACLEAMSNDTTTKAPYSSPPSTTTNTTFSKMKNLASKVKKAAMDTFDNTVEKIDAMVSDTHVEELNPFNWENKDAAVRCRQCSVTFNLISVPKRRCKSCGGVFCDQCATYCTNDSNVSKATDEISTGQDISSPRMCDACRKGQCPSDRMMTMVEKLFNSGKHRFTFSKAPSPLNLEHGSKFGEDGSGLKNSSNPPSSGYFELWNKSDAFIAVKVLPEGGDQLWELARPRYYAIPPQAFVCADFSPACKHLDLFILYDNPYSMPDGGALVYDTVNDVRASSVERISKCALSSEFREASIYSIGCKDKNAILKYKGNGIVERRNGMSMNRVGLLGWAQGKMSAKEKIDFSTNTFQVQQTFTTSDSSLSDDLGDRNTDSTIKQTNNTAADSSEQPVRERRYSKEHATPIAEEPTGNGVGRFHNSIEKITGTYEAPKSKLKTAFNLSAFSSSSGSKDKKTASNVYGGDNSL